MPIIVGFKVVMDDFVATEPFDSNTVCSEGHKPEHVGQRFCPECGGLFGAQLAIKTTKLPALDALIQACPETEDLGDVPESLPDSLDLYEWWTDTLDGVITNSDQKPGDVTIVSEDEDYEACFIGVIFETAVHPTVLLEAVEPVAKVQAAMGMIDRPIGVQTYEPW